MSAPAGSEARKAKCGWLVRRAHDADRLGCVGFGALDDVHPAHPLPGAGSPSGARFQRRHAVRARAVRVRRTLEPALARRRSRRATRTTRLSSGRADPARRSAAVRNPRRHARGGVAERPLRARAHRRPRGPDGPPPTALRRCTGDKNRPRASSTPSRPPIPARSSPCTRPPPTSPTTSPAAPACEGPRERHQILRHRSGSFSRLPLASSAYCCSGLCRHADRRQPCMQRSGVGLEGVRLVDSPRTPRRQAERPRRVPARARAVRSRWARSPCCVKASRWRVAPRGRSRASR
ncbi:hypothetical protein SAMN05421504_11148 [Amycolatopsis xylanica]|uniref:Uncharacterized protein n=1 Tax=Amycolatopsis xylanica TaxID=589385 RepID=A0A1H3RG84_9PSEU|nr:hypothetical protein SAMN05421504_11148 [Amycolatopsis xylanica]